MPNHKQLFTARTLLWLMLVTLIIRLLSLGLYPLMDTTEARYGEIARLMAETGNWITPQIDYQIPFWGKPPLYSWLTAASFQLLGVNEFSARLPHFLLGLLVLCLVWIVARRQGSQLKAALSCLILSTTGAFLICSGAVMTDMSLLLATTLSLTAFWLAWHSEQNKGGVWGLLLFVGLALGLLAKGPIACILVGLPILLWCLTTRHLNGLWYRLPWITGLLLMLALALPWYLMAEQATPGFLDYFLIGEHFRRFLESGWQGDRYGTAHIEPKGMIWFMWSYAALPWSVVLLALVIRRRKRVFLHKASASTPAEKEWRSFLWFWMLSPLLFFTLSGNILWTYVLPGLPAMALLLADYIGTLLAEPGASIQGNQKRLRFWVIAPACLSPIVLIGLVVMANNNLKHTAKGLVDSYHHTSPQNADLVFWPKRPFSGQFYSKGQGQIITDQNALIKKITASPNLYVAMPPASLQTLPSSIRNQLQLVQRGAKLELWKKKT
ncbi:ArnT family glycosyltransferase [Parendozoicomonas haliclonae]|uniref:Undecaprenyl phosphate-alpha-4-amino-4-deoxy-L-arabinose arabinosyl transferase n=1 Tax=Parendozoicomonas haliclonae TaxID=1960125 RepID=A0A1X7APU2_9GAMM|nr:glycosyltransferase family 39 protein [Parendozoicomonas haliclonae]SMA50120.1 Undecaprenyl phosphate-alpha-4-amino-4-deoxy-L-arabinose arabinosyl transferase [Parendozoicomonas haliclonae]